MFRCSLDMPTDATAPVIRVARAFGAPGATRTSDSISTAVDALVLVHPLKSAEGVLWGGDPGPG